MLPENETEIARRQKLQKCKVEKCYQLHLRRKNLCVDVENNLKHPYGKQKLKIL